MILIRNIYGANEVRFIAQCGDRFLMISHSNDPRNGFMLADWTQVLREVVALAVPAKMTERFKTAESQISGTYSSMNLTYPLHAPSLAALLGVPADEVRSQLADLAVDTDP